MDKIAMVKQAEVEGVIAGLVDADYIKLASAEDFDTVCGIVAENIADTDYTFDDVVTKTAEVMEEVYQIYEENGLLEKEASEQEYSDSDIMAAIGELTLAKEAGDVEGEEADSKMKKLKSMLAANKGKVVGGAAGLAALAAIAHPKSREYIMRRSSSGNQFKAGLLEDLKTLKAKGGEAAAKGVSKAKGVLDNMREPASAGNKFSRPFKNPLKYFKKN